jgi:sensor c-di-GMP phosphodiesterase-like protein
LNRIFSISLAMIVGAFAVVVPIAVSLNISHQESLDTEMRGALTLADEVLHRTDKTTEQIAAALQKLERGKRGDPCSPEQIDLMQDIDVSSSYLQAV